MAVGKTRNEEATRAGLERWLRARYPERRDLVVAPLTKPATGLSSDTLFVDVSWAGGDESLVARLPPDGGGLFPTYDLARQARIQQAVADAGIPVPPPVAVEDDEGWVGSPFLLMPRIPGRTLGTNPSYVVQGWLHDAPPEEQSRLHAAFFETLADIHRLDWNALGIDGEPGLVASVASWSDYLDWASDGNAPLPVLADGLAWCRENVPDPEPPASLLWGDVQMVNAVWGDDLRPTAIVDWEMSSIGPAEMDVGWFFALHGMTAANSGDLPGFPGRAETLAYYEARLGRPLDDIHWFEMWGLLRSGAIVVRIAKILAEQGIDDGWLSSSNPTADRLRELLP